MRSIMEKSDQSSKDPLQDEIERLEVKIELLLQNMQFDLNQLVGKYNSFDDPKFQKELIMNIGANSREAS